MAVQGLGDMANKRAIVYSPVRDWSKGDIKVLVKNGPAGRQYTLEGVTEWEKIERFQELSKDEAGERRRGIWDYLHKGGMQIKGKQ
ncbi:hypothetical protein EV426DRAFT_711447 [Tirmania nivea]|nr:hypothetical protein EV426DRAFT_711447 [Tirmania nivea]